MTLDKIAGKIVMLPTPKASIIQLNNNRIITYRPSRIFGDMTMQHLYVLSTDNIKIGDWIYIFNKNSGYRTVIRCQNIDTYGYITHNPNHKVYPVEMCTKIVASSDPSLGLPLISDNFIFEYTKRHNNGDISAYCERHKTKDVSVEVILEWSDNELVKGLPQLNIAFKNPVKHKPMYTHEEVRWILRDLANTIENAPADSASTTCEEYISINL